MAIWGCCYVPMELFDAVICNLVIKTSIFNDFMVFKINYDVNVGKQKVRKLFFSNFRSMALVVWAIICELILLALDPLITIGSTLLWSTAIRQCLLSYSKCSTILDVISNQIQVVILFLVFKSWTKIIEIAMLVVMAGCDGEHDLW